MSDPLSAEEICMYALRVTRLLQEQCVEDYDNVCGCDRAEDTSHCHRLPEEVRQLHKYLEEHFPSAFKPE